MLYYLKMSSIHKGRSVTRDPTAPSDHFNHFAILTRLVSLAYLPFHSSGYLKQTSNFYQTKPETVMASPVKCLRQSGGIHGTLMNKRTDKMQTKSKCHATKTKATERYMLIW